MKLDSGIIIPDNYTVFNKPTDLEMSQRKLEDYRKWAEIRAWGLRNPVKFLEEIIGVSLLDNQAYALSNGWFHKYVIWLESRAAGKTTVAALFLMLKTALFNDYKAVICSGTAAQSIESYKKLEELAKKQIASFTGLTDFYISNVVSSANSDGFIHNPMSFTVSLFNSSNIRTINSNIDKQRGKRANLVFFDECGFLDEETLQVISAYATNNSDFKLGGNIDINVLPKNFPNQLVFASSASSIDSAFFKRYRDYSKKMLLGHPDYFVCDINSDVVIQGLYKGKPYPVPLLSQETVDNEYRANPEKAAREYGNRFSKDGGANAIVKRSWIARNSQTYVPELFNIDDKSEYVFCYDSARTNDNSFVLIGRFIYDEEKGWKVKIVNGVNFADLGLRRHTPMRLPEQIVALKELIVAYNGKNPDFEKLQIYTDGGTGGSGNTIPDFFMEDWYEDGHLGDVNYLHRGLIDKEYSAEYVSRYPNAVKGVLHVMNPQTYKSLMYESLIQNVQNDLIIFPQEYDNHGYLNIIDIDDKAIKAAKAEMATQGLSEDEIAAKILELDAGHTTTKKLSLEDEVGLTQIDLMKEEVVNICRFKSENSNKDRFGLPAHKVGDGVSNNTMHDDRAYTLAMLSYALTLKRTKDRLNRTKKKSDKSVAEIVPINMRKIQKAIG